ncbi:MAG: hypothetical protein ACNA8W_18685 [Bradymonadaceae bacterium]
MRIKTYYCVGALILTLGCGDDGGDGPDGGNGSAGTISGTFSEYGGVEFTGDARFAMGETQSGRGFTNLLFDVKNSAMEPTSGTISFTWASADVIEEGVHTLPDSDLLTLTTLILGFDGASVGARESDCTGDFVVDSSSTRRIQGSLDMTCPGIHTYIEDGSPNTESLEFTITMEFDARHE